MKNPPKKNGTLKHSGFSAPHISHSPRLLVAWLPFFRLERCGWSPHEVVALVQPQHGVQRVLATSEPAARGGVRIGMNVAQARALVPSLHLEHFDSADAEQADLQELAQQLEVLGPLPAPFSPDSLCIDISQSSEVLGGEASCLELAMKTLRSLNHFSRIWIVDSDRIGASIAARALAQWKKKHQIVALNGQAQALVEMPLDFLPISPPLRSSLHALGIRKAGDLAALPAASVGHRYGEEGLWLQGICQGRPRREAPAPNASPKPRLHSTHLFTSPATHIPRLMAALTTGIQDISRALQHRNQACSKLHLRLELESHPDRHLHVHLGRPSRNPDQLSDLLKKRLEGLQLRSGIEAGHLSALELCSYNGEQRNLLDRTQTQEEFSALFARLKDSLGSQALLSPTLQDTHRPESAWTHSTASAQSSPVSSLERPTLLLSIPRVIAVQSNNGQPTHAVLEGRSWSIHHCQGPERISGEWWRLDDFDRDYWTLHLSNGRRPWVFQDRSTQQWWLHGWFE